ncbi:hypothetical protein POM88_033425 [Heracleum sosnowskyi]|uniref:Uncharacterized protein n=1 Tax=Heracleum sosnowskyi TaxID=360622 RepID=A0AAD8I387_9APIA|nr:hypothetical protein POM88_033425 [Heracleum sosnowskyi]
MLQDVMFRLLNTVASFLVSLSFCHGYSRVILTSIVTITITICTFSVPFHEKVQLVLYVSLSVNGVPITSDHEKSGPTGNNRSQGIVVTTSENQGVKGGVQDKGLKAAISPFENNTTVDLDNMDNNEFIISDPKRRRKAHDVVSPNENMMFGPNEKEIVMEDSIQNEQQNQKNLLLAGTALQSRPSS